MQLAVDALINPLRALPARKHLGRRELPIQRYAPKHQQGLAVSGLVLRGGDENQGVGGHCGKALGQPRRLRYCTGACLARF